MTASSTKHCPFSSLIATVIAAMVLVQALPARADTAQQGMFYEDAKRGWFWYEKQPEPPPADEPEASPAPGVLAVFLPDMRDYTTEQLWNLHPDQFRPLLEAFQKKAVMEPSVENMRDYVKMQDIARRKAAEFAMASGYTVQTNPEYDLNRDYPVSTPGRTARTRMQRQEVQSRLAAANQDHALVYFYSPSCSFCQEQNGILQYFVERTGWEVKAINIDEHPEMAARFHVETTPSMILVKRGNDDYIPAAVGVVSLDTLEDRLYRGVRLLNNEITPQEYALFDYQRGGTMDPRSILRQPTQ